MHHHYADLNGITLHCVAADAGREASDGRRELMLFVHGFPEFWYAWKDLLAHFGDDYHAVAPDLRGYNLSSRPQDPAEYKPRILIEDIRRLVEHLGYQQCILVAHDWGGAIAWGFAAAYPRYVSKLVSINSPHPVPFARDLLREPAQQQASAYMNFFRTPAAEQKLLADDCRRLERMLRSGPNETWMTDDDRAAYRTAWKQPDAITGGLNYYRASPLHPPQDARDEAVLARVADDKERFQVNVPTLVIWGMRDSALLPGLLDGLGACVPELSIERIATASHWVVHEQPAAVIDAMRGFIGR